MDLKLDLRPELSVILTVCKLFVHKGNMKKHAGMTKSAQPVIFTDKFKERISQLKSSVQENASRKKHRYMPNDDLIT